MSTLSEAVVAVIEGATSEEGFGPPTIDVPAASWHETVRSVLAAGAEFFDFLSAYDEQEDGFAVVMHVAAADGADHVLIRTRIPRDQPSLPTVTDVYRGASWHERETHEMFGIDFAGHPNLIPLLLPPGFDATPLRKDFVLASRVAKAWPGAKEPGEAPGGAPTRRAITAPGVPADWAQGEPS